MQLPKVGYPRFTFSQKAFLRSCRHAYGNTEKKMYYNQLPIIEIRFPLVQESMHALILVLCSKC